MTKLSITAAFGAIMVLSACQMPQQHGALGPLGPTSVDGRGIYTQGALAQANRLVDRFEADRLQGGMSTVAADISDCYREATRPYVQIKALRECMIFDDFAVKFDRVATHRYGIGGISFFSVEKFSLRLQRFGGLAGFNDSEVLGGYIGQGATTMFAVLASRRRQ